MDRWTHYFRSEKFLKTWGVFGVALFLAAFFLVLAVLGVTRSCSGTVDPVRERASAGQDEKTTLFPRNDLACTPESVQAISNWFDGWITHGASALVLDSAYLPQYGGLSLDGRTWKNILVLRTRERSWVYDNLRQGNVGEVKFQVEQSRKEEALLAAREGVDVPEFRVSLALAEGVSMERVMDTLVLMKGLQVVTIAFIFRAPKPPAELEMVPSDIKKRVQEPLSSQEHRAAAMGCQPVLDIWGELEAIRPAEHNSYLRDYLGEAWRACDCEPDLELLIAGHLSWPTRRPPDRVRYVSFPIDEAINQVAGQDGLWGEFVSRGF